MASNLKEVIYEACMTTPILHLREELVMKVKDFITAKTAELMAAHPEFQGMYQNLYNKITEDQTDNRS